MWDLCPVVEKQMIGCNLFVLIIMFLDVKLYYLCSMPYLYAIQVILKEREERKKNRLLEEQGLSPSTQEVPNTGLDAAEIPCDVDQPDSPGTCSSILCGFYSLTFKFFL